MRSLAAAMMASVLVMPAFGPSLGCALFSRGKTLETQWYTPERAAPPMGLAEMQGQRGCELRLGRVTSGANLGPRIAYGDGLYRVDYYEAERWTERPDHYVRRALSRTLFEEGRFLRSPGGDAPTLDVELLEFQEVKGLLTHSARVAVHVLLATDRVLLERTIVVSQPVQGDSVEAFVAAMARALEGTSSEVARAVNAATGCG